MDFVKVRPTMLDDHIWFRPYMETSEKTKLPFVETGAVVSFETFPEMEEIAGVVERYGRWVG